MTKMPEAFIKIMQDAEIPMSQAQEMYDLGCAVIDSVQDSMIRKVELVEPEYRALFFSVSIKMLGDWLKISRNLIIEETLKKIVKESQA